jgi:hypothetical protein
VKKPAELTKVVAKKEANKPTQLAQVRSSVDEELLTQQ